MVIETASQRPATLQDFRTQELALERHQNFHGPSPPTDNPAPAHPARGPAPTVPWGWGGGGSLVPIF